MKGTRHCTTRLERNAPRTSASRKTAQRASTVRGGRCRMVLAWAVSQFLRAAWIRSTHVLVAAARGAAAVAAVLAQVAELARMAPAGTAPAGTTRRRPKVIRSGDRRV